jgi:hypothetical protein
VNHKFNYEAHDHDTSPPGWCISTEEERIFCDMEDVREWLRRALDHISEGPANIQTIEEMLKKAHWIACQRRGQPPDGRLQGATGQGRGRT